MKNHIKSFCSLFLLWFSNFVFHSYFQLCNSQSSTFKPGQVQLVGIFPNTVDYKNQSSNLSRYFNPENIQLTQAMIYTIEELINHNPALLPNIQVGWTLLDSSSSINQTMELLSSVLSNQKLSNTGQSHTKINNTNNAPSSLPEPIYNISANSSPIFGVIGAKLYNITVKTASYTSKNHFTQVSYFFNQSLTDQQQFPYFYSTSVPDDLYWYAIKEIITYFNWNWISIVIAGNTISENIIQDINRLPQNHGICYDEILMIDQNYTLSSITKIILKLKNQTKSEVVVLLGNELIIYRFFQQADIHQLTGKTWIGSYHWLISPSIYSIRSSILNGVIGISFNSVTMQAFNLYLDRLNLCNNLDNIWFRQALQEIISIDAKIPSCTFNKTRIRYFQAFYKISPISAFVMDATLALAHALHKYLGCNETYCPSISEKSFNNQQFNNILSKIRFDGISSRSFRFAPNGNSQISFNIVNLQSSMNSNTSRFEPVDIGYWNQNEGLILNEESIVWNHHLFGNNKPLSRCSQDCLPGYYMYQDRRIKLQHRSCCWSCRLCQNRTISNTTNQSTCTKCPILTNPDINRTYCADLSILKLSYTSPISIICYVAIGLYLLLLIFIWTIMIAKRQTPIVKGSNFILINLLLAFLALLVLVSVLHLLPATPEVCAVKNYLVTTSCIGIYTTILCKTNQVKNIFQNVTNMSSRRKQYTKTYCQVAFILVFLFLSNGILTAFIIILPFPLLKYRDGNQTVIDCNIQYFYGHINLVCWSIVIVSTCLYLAYKTRSLPENFNESKYIFMSTLAVSIIAIATFMVDSFTSGVATIALSITNTLLLGAAPMIFLFLPKLYIIFFRPHLNTRAQATKNISHFTFAKGGIREKSTNTQEPTTNIGCNETQKEHQSPNNKIHSINTVDQVAEILS
ncbi:Metabotropic glutamate receptor 7 [Trichoplax sp. H2]|nr:Metabotropic glutamate receptor 7 [Trichoplax sp. H2]|eukprot:RDD39075.1 Metabotropic glutamate receptor 7 [Trichoplax sp. H2]